MKKVKSKVKNLMVHLNIKWKKYLLITAERKELNF
jgi:hypothetical protein